MEVTVKNLQEAHERIADLFSKSKIVFIVFSGLSSKPAENGYKSYDYPFDLYFKQFRFSKYGLIQIGITLIEKINDQEFKAHPFIFYLFPNDEASQIIVSADLFELDVDWNKWMAHGIPYKNKEQIDKLRAQLYNIAKTDQKKETYYELFNKLDEMKQEIVKAQLEKFNQFLENNEITEFMFDAAYTNIRRLYYTFLEENHPQLIMLKCGNNQIGIKKCTVQEKQIHDEQIIKEKEDKIEEQKGASRTFELIFKFCQEKNVPFVMFNSLFELSQIISYTQQYLPRSFLEFKQVVQQTLPTVIDIKNIDPTAYVQKHQNQLAKYFLKVMSENENNSIVQKSCDIARIWILDQQKLQHHTNKVFFDKSNWIISINQNQKDTFLIPENKVYITFIPGENAKSQSQKRYSIQKIFQELYKYHKKVGVFYQKSETQNMIVATVDTTKINDIEGLKKGYQKLKDAQFSEYEAFYPVLLNTFEEYNKQNS